MLECSGKGTGMGSGRQKLRNVTYFFDDTPFDVDNIPKPILDALKGLVFRDDSQVYDLLCRKRNFGIDRDCS